MKILSLDTSAAHCAAALLDGQRVLGARVEPMTRGQAERLLPMADALMKGHGLAWRDLDALAVGIGPGNFTGIRIAVSAVRGLALSLGIPAIGVTTFEALADGVDGPCLVCLDARQDRFYAAGFGGADLPPQVADLGLLTAAALPEGSVVLGHRAAEIAAQLGLRAGAEDTAPRPESIARVAAARPGPHAAPAPMYMRGADAAPPSEPPPRILDDA